MRIGVLTTGFPSSESDPTGSFVWESVRALAARGHRVDVLAPEPAVDANPPSHPGVTLQHVSYLRPRRLQATFYGAGVLDNLRQRPEAWLGLAPFTLALLAQARTHATQWDGLISHWGLPCGAIGASLPRALPHVAIFHSADVHLLERLPGGSAVTTHILRRCRQAVCVSAALRARVLAMVPVANRRAYAQRVSILPMAGAFRAPATPRTAVRARLGLRGFTVVSVARLVPIKGLDVLIDACAQLTDVGLVIAGDGPQRRRLEQRARARGADVRFVGRVTPAQRDELLHAADAFALCSRVLTSGRTEGTPVAVIEAMQAGLPVVASAVGGLVDLLAGGRGVLVPPDRPQAVAATIERLRGDPALRVSLASQAHRYAAKLDWGAHSAAVEQWLGGSQLRLTDERVACRPAAET